MCAKVSECDVLIVRSGTKVTAIADKIAVKEACESGQLGGYGRDVWDEQPTGKDRSWHYMPNNAMTSYISGTTLDSQKRFVVGAKDRLDQWFKQQSFPEQNYIVREGKLASQYLEIVLRGTDAFLLHVELIHRFLLLIKTMYTAPTCLGPLLEELHRFSEELRQGQPRKHLHQQGLFQQAPDLRMALAAQFPPCSAPSSQQSGRHDLH